MRHRRRRSTGRRGKQYGRKRYGRKKMMANPRARIAKRRNRMIGDRL